MKEKLTKELKEYGLDLAHTDLHNSWIGVEEIEANIHRYFPDSMKMDDQKVSSTIILAGLASYNILLTERQPYKPNQYMRQFLHGCFTVINKVCGFCSSTADQVRDDEDETVISLMDYRADDMEIDSSSVTGVYDSLVPRNIKLAMRRFGHEEAIIGTPFTSNI